MARKCSGCANPQRRDAGIDDSKNLLDAIFRIVIRADTERVWRDLTRTGEAQGAVFNAWLHTTALAPGGRLQMRAGTGKYVLFVGEVLEFDPPHRFVHSHRFTLYDDPVGKVAYDLKPLAGSVAVTLKVIGMPAGTRTAESMQQGGKAMLDTLKVIAEIDKLGAYEKAPKKTYVSMRRN